LTLKRPSINIYGSKLSAESEHVKKVKAVPRQKNLAAYVGRLHINTTEEDLTQYLLDEEMKGIVCKRLKAKNGQSFKTAAFYVTCCVESSDLFYTDSCWPEGTEVRDWHYYSK